MKVDGIKYTHEPDANYHAKSKSGEYLSSHLLADFRKSPAIYKAKIDGVIVDSDSPAYALGRATHKLILEGLEAFNAAYVVADGPINEKTGKPYGSESKAYKDWEAQQGKPVVKTEDFKLIDAMDKAVDAHEGACALLFDGLAESVIREEYRGVACQIRPDFISKAGHGGLVDLKTCDDLTWFESDARRYGYIHQMAFYRSVLAVASGLPVVMIPVHLIAVEKHAPYRVGVWELGRDILEICANDNAVAIDRLQQCRTSNTWETGYEEVRELVTL